MIGYREWFDGRRLVVATMHGKESVIGPALDDELGVDSFVPGGLDTDLLGTFTGEIAREDDLVTVLRKKCLMGMVKGDCDLAVASEGSFGPHPSIYFAPADDERVMLLDRKNNLEIVGGVLSTDTNYMSAPISDWSALESFALKAGFPTHAVILREHSDQGGLIFKGLTDVKQLHDAFGQIHQLRGVVYAETDMRAMYNPTRMRVIGLAVQNLIERIRILCPGCARPGFGITDIVPGLPCRDCGMPTRSSLYAVHSCGNCGYREEKVRPGQKPYEEPQFCDNCNP